MQFKDVIGQSLLKTELKKLLHENRLAHAMLFLGKEGSGALPLALAFAQYLVCEKAHLSSLEKVSANAAATLFAEDPAPSPSTAETRPALDSCNSCPSCLKAREMVHPDIHFSYPVVTKKAGTPPLSSDYIAEWRDFIKTYPYGNVYDWLQLIGAENKQGNITANECNDIARKLNLKSFEGGYKALIMWLPEYLGNEGNKLLKLIEEPPEKTIFLLVAENDSQVLQTILSRCQLIRVPQPEPTDIKEALITRNKTDEQTASRVSALAEGNYRDALQLMQHADEDWQHLLRDWLNSIIKSGPVAQGKWVEEAGQLGREKQKQFLRYFTHLLQLALRLRMVPQNAEKYPQTETDFAVRLNKITNIAQQEAMAELLNEAAFYIERNAHGKMLFMALTIKIYHIIQDNIVLLNE